MFHYFEVPYYYRTFCTYFMNFNNIKLFLFTYNSPVVPTVKRLKITNQTKAY